MGGSIDIVTKTPKNDNFINSSIGFGTDGYKRATVDANHKINDTTAVRLNVMGHDANRYRPQRRTTSAGASRRRSCSG